MTKTGEFVKASSLKLRLKNNLIEATCNLIEKYEKSFFSPNSSLPPSLIGGRLADDSDRHDYSQDRFFRNFRSGSFLPICNLNS